MILLKNKSHKVTTDFRKEKWNQAKKFAEFFMDIGFQSLELQKYKFSIQAMAAVLATRKVLGIKPIWNTRFQIFTNYMYEDVKDWFEELYAKYEKHFSKYNKSQKVKSKENRWETKAKVKKQLVQAPKAAKIGKTSRIQSGTRLGAITKPKQLSKNSSQPRFDKFSQRKPSYISYVKNSKIQVTLKNGKKLKNAQSLSRVSSITAIGALKNKRRSVDCYLKSNNTSTNRVQTPQNVLKGRIAKIPKKRQVTSGSISSRGQSINYRKLRAARIQSSQRSILGIEQKFQTQESASSRNRSVTSRGKIVSMNRLPTSRVLTKKIKLTDRSISRLNTQEWNNKEIFETSEHQILTMRDLNKRQETLQNSDGRDCNFTMTDESVVASNLNPKKPRKVKWINNIKLIQTSKLNHQVKYKLR